MTDLEKQAEELGIKVDKRWSADRLQQEIDKALAAPAPAALDTAKEDAEKAELDALRAEKAEREKAETQRKADEKRAVEAAKAEADAEAERVEKEAKKLFPVKLVKNYRPIADFFILDEEGDYREPTDEERQKVTAGNSIKLPVLEAQSVIDKEIAKRNDPIR
ncbi:hypothetical protein [Rhizobium leguminosarum]